ncbi:ATP-binding cassette transporter snq2 [Basidiobolus ranarum]|uniref:ATP-binding cassette transporter snq2 n=1 Tax=Basidiobolus ranarum TaxID=34480 RepID=A0ABR2W0S4_9FUNG
MSEDSSTNNRGSRDSSVTVLGDDHEKMQGNTLTKTQVHLQTENQAGDWGEGEPSIDISNATGEYEDLRRELSRISTIHRRNTVASSDTALEEGPQGDGFDLNDFLQEKSIENKNADIKEKCIGLTFKHLTVIGDKVGRVYMPDCLTPLKKLGNLFNPAKWCQKQEPNNDDEGRVILHDIDGFCKDGEMLFVLGRPGAGCSTLLRVLSNERKQYRKIEGEVSYGGISAEEFSKKYTGEVAYNPEDDFHFATLTVRETMNFALKCKTPGKRLPDETKKSFVRDVRDTLLKMFGLSHTLDTLVGNEYVRGVSGGERKRLSIAEQMTARAAINMWDGSTKGLDASSALSYVKSLRIMTNIMHKATLVTTYQASESIYQEFDKVMVLDQGRCVYFGPASEARRYFINLGFQDVPRQTTSDYLTAITDPHERKITPGMEDRVPQTAEEMEQAYKKSDIYHRMIQERDEYEEYLNCNSPEKDFRKHVEESKQNHVPRKSPYTTSFPQQVKALTVRQFQLTLGDKASLISRYASIMIKAAIVGTAFLLLPTDNVSGAFTRGGVLFFSLLFNSLVAQAEIPNSMSGRSILYKHKSFAFYYPSAYYIAQMAADIPFTMIQIVLFSCILYWSAGLQAEAGKFFNFMFILVLCSFSLTAYFRMFASFSPNFDVASRTSGIVLMAYILYCGYLIPQNQMHGWFVWIYWINPLAYGFKALMSNEFKGLRFTCSGIDLVPSGPNYNNINYQTCSLVGSRPGTNYVDGPDYLIKSFGYNTDDMWKDTVTVICWWILFSILSMIAMECKQFGKGGFTLNMYKPTKEPIQKKDQSEMSESRVNIEEKSGDVKLEGITFTWHNVDYVVPAKGFPDGKQLLNKIDGWVKPGYMTALMGASGAGKTTLLDVLAQRKSIGKVTGDILVDQRPIGVDFQRTTGYCEQMDVHNPAVTVRESLQFSAYLRQPAEIPKGEKDAYVEEIIRLLEMEDIADAVIGDVETGVGISVEQRKRLTIGVELVAKPKLLFLDEPTSGLDAQAAFNIIRFMRKLADQGQAVLCTIHQPSAVLFDFFDHLLLLARGGKTVYFGELGPDSKEILDYFSRNGAPVCGSEANPAEYILDVVNDKRALDWPTIWSESPERRQVQITLDQIQSKQLTVEEKKNQHEFATSFGTQFSVVGRRMLLSWWRNPTYNLGRHMFCIVFSLLLGFSFYRMGHSQKELQSRIFALFQSSVMGTIFMNLSQPRFIEERNVYNREHSSKMYGWKPFWLSIMLTEIPFISVTITCFWLLYYYICGFNQSSSHAIYSWLMYLIFAYFCISLGQTIASFSSSKQMAALLNPFFFSMLNLFCGVVVPYSSMPGFWKAWMYWLDPFHYWIEGLVTNELHNLKVYCTGDEYLLFNPPSGQTCVQYAGEFLTKAAGYLHNPEATSACQYCPMSRGDDFYTPLGWSYSHRWRNFGFLCMFWIFNVVVTGVIIAKFRSNSR